MKTLFVVVGALVLAACSEHTGSATIGMTYDEVTSAMGRPTAITRGVNHIAEPDGLNLSFHVTTTGVFLYETWRYGPTRTARIYGKPFIEANCVVFDAASGRVVSTGYQPIRRVQE